MVKKFISKDGQIFDSNMLLPLDAIEGPWNSIEEFKNFISNAIGVTDLSDLPIGIKIRVINNGKYVEYHWNGSSFKDTKEDIKNDINSLTGSISGINTSLGVINEHLSGIDGNITSINNSKANKTDVANSLNAKADKTEVNEIGTGLAELANVRVHKIETEVSNLKNKDNQIDTEIQNTNSLVSKNAIDISNATFSDESELELEPEVSDSILKSANEAAVYAAKAADEVIKAKAQLTAINKTLEDIKNSDDIDPAIAAAIAKNSGDIIDIKTILGEKLLEVTCTYAFTMVTYHLSAGVSYVIDCYRYGGMEIYSMTANSISSDTKEKLLDQSSGNRFIKITPTQDVEYLRIYSHDIQQGNRIVSIYPLGISQRLDEINKSIENIDDTRTKVLSVMDKVGGDLITFEATGNQYTTVACNIKKGNLYKITCSRSGSVQFITKTVSYAVNSADDHVVDNIQLSSVQQIYFTASNDASYIQIYSNTYAQTINVSIDNIKEGNIFKGKKCVWLGTSIPANGIPGENRIEAYPMIVGDILGMQVVNKSLSSSNIAIKKNSATITNKSSMLCLSMTKAEMRTEWGAAADDTVISSSYEEIFKAITPNTDIVVIDHGFNDRARCKEDVETGYDNINFDSTDRNTWHGAFKYILDKIYYINPRIKVIIAGYFTNNHLVDVNNTDTMNTKDICTAQEYLAKAYNLQILRVWNILGVNDNTVDVSDEYISEYNSIHDKNVSTLTRFSLFCPDGVHPHTDKTGKSLKDYADAIVQCLNSN